MAAISYTTSDFLSKITNNGNRYVSNYSKRVREADTGVQDSQDEIADFRKKVRLLRNYDTDNFDADEVERNLTSFVESYNSLKEALTDADNDELNKQMEEIEELIDDNSTSLKKLGVKLSDDELTFDEDTFEDLTDKEIKKYADKLFVGSDSFIGQTSKIMRDMEQTSEDEEYNIVKRKFYTVTEYSEAEIAAATAAKNLVSALTKCTGIVENYDEDSAKTSLSNYTSYYNTLIAQNESLDNTDISSAKEKTEENITKLNSIGITEEDSQLTYSTETEITKEAYADVFDSTMSTYASDMTTICDNVINSVLKADKIGITLDVKV